MLVNSFISITYLLHTYYIYLSIYIYTYLHYLYIYAYIYIYHIHTPSRIAKLVFPLMLLFDLQRRKISGGQRQLLRENRPFKGHAAVENGADLQRVNPTIHRFSGVVHVVFDFRGSQNCGVEIFPNIFMMISRLFSKREFQIHSSDLSDPQRKASFRPRTRSPFKVMRSSSPLAKKSGYGDVRFIFTCGVCLQYGACLCIYLHIYIYICVYIYIYYMSNRQNYCKTNLVLLRLSLSEIAQNLHSRQGTTLYPYPICDTSAQPIGDDPNLCMALDLTYNFVHYSHVCTNTYVYVILCIYIYMHIHYVYVYIDRYAIYVCMSLCSNTAVYNI